MTHGPVRVYHEKPCWGLNLGKDYLAEPRWKWVLKVEQNSHTVSWGPVKASQAEKRGTCEMRTCERLRKQQRARGWKEGRQEGYLEEERGSSNRLLGTGDEGPQETDCSLNTNGKLFSRGDN